MKLVAKQPGSSSSSGRQQAAGSIRPPWRSEAQSALLEARKGEGKGTGKGKGKGKGNFQEWEWAAWDTYEGKGGKGNVGKDWGWDWAMTGTGGSSTNEGKSKGKGTEKGKDGMGKGTGGSSSDQAGSLSASPATQQSWNEEWAELGIFNGGGEKQARPTKSEPPKACQSMLALILSC